MALISCVECGKEFSDRATACPNCACPIDVMVEQPEAVEIDYKHYYNRTAGSVITAAERIKADCGGNAISYLPELIKAHYELHNTYNVLSPKGKKKCPLCQAELGFLTPRTDLIDCVVCLSCLEKLNCDTSLTNLMKISGMTLSRLVTELSENTPNNVSNVQVQHAQSEDEVRCPKCGSTSLSANKKGFGVGKAIVGGVLTGGVGLAAGAIGKNKVEVTCLKCGKQFKAGKGA